MPGIVLLPEDLLSDILCLCAGSSISHKFALAQVSAHWRRVALDSPLLWTWICLSTRLDCNRLDLVLDRCGPCAPLHIEVSGPPFWETDSTPLELAMHTLEPYAARIRVLNMEEPSDHLLNCGLDFPELRTLRVIDFRVGDTHSPHEIRLRAPDLRVISLSGVVPVALPDLLSDQLVKVTLVSCPGIVSADLWTVLARCINVEDLTFQMCKVEVDTLSNIPRMRRLRKLHIGLPVPILVKVLDDCVSHDTVLDEAVASIAWGHDPDVIRQVCTALLRGMGPLATFRAAGNRYIRLQDTAGRKRVLHIWNLLGAWKHVWPYLAESHGAHKSVKEIGVPFELWNEFADDFAAHPPGANVEHCRVMFDGPVAESRFSDASEDPLPAFAWLFLPGLQRVTFESCGYQLQPCIVVRVLRSILCDAGRTVHVETSWQSAQNSQAIRVALDKEGRGRWIYSNRI